MRKVWTGIYQAALVAFFASLVGFLPAIFVASELGADWPILTAAGIALIAFVLVSTGPID